MKITITDGLPAELYHLNQLSPASKIPKQSLPPAVMAAADSRDKQMFRIVVGKTSQAIRDGEFRDDEDIYDMYLIVNFRGKAPYNTYETFLATKGIRKAFCRAAQCSINAFNSTRIIHRENQNNSDLILTNIKP